MFYDPLGDHGYLDQTNDDVVHVYDTLPVSQLKQLQHSLVS